MIRSPKDAQLEIEYYRLKVDELQLTLELEEQNRTLGEARRRKVVDIFRSTRVNELSRHWNEKMRT